MIRVFSVPTGDKLYQFRRGTYPARIYCIQFNVANTLLSVSSDTDTVHVFKLLTEQERLERAEKVERRPSVERRYSLLDSVYVKRFLVSIALVVLIFAFDSTW